MEEIEKRGEERRGEEKREKENRRVCIRIFLECSALLVDPYSSIWSFNVSKDHFGVPLYHLRRKHLLIDINKEVKNRERRRRREYREGTQVWTELR